MDFQAIVFDLFGTLVDDFVSSVGQMDTEMAAALGVPYDQFMLVWNQTLDMRIIGAFETVEANIEYVLNAMNEHARVEQIERAVEIRMRYIGWALQPRADAVSTLARLKTEGFKLGLISNASIEIPMVWQETPFAGLIDEPIFSSQAHLKKPDVSIYHLACKRLALSAESCLYVGDGEDHELSAAATVGLHPVLIRSSSTQSMSRLHQEAKEWQGATITRLPEILQLV